MKLAKETRFDFCEFLVKESERFHDRYFIIDRKTLVHIGASLNYFGKKCFACSTFDPIDIPEMLAKLQM